MQTSLQNIAAQPYFSAAPRGHNHTKSNSSDYNIFQFDNEDKATFSPPTGGQKSKYANGFITPTQGKHEANKTYQTRKLDLWEKAEAIYQAQQKK